MLGKVSLFRRHYLPPSIDKQDAHADPSRLFSFTVNTDALIGAGIFTEDRAIALRSSTYQSRQLVIGLYDNVLLVRYAYIDDDGRLRLESRNPAYPVIQVHPSSFKVKGVVLRIMRDL